VLQLLTGFAGSGIRHADIVVDHDGQSQRRFKKLNGIDGTLLEWGLPDGQRAHTAQPHSRAVWLFGPPHLEGIFRNTGVY
jgi:hypothetical protein